MSAATSAPGGRINATIDNAPGGAQDWMALAVVGAANDKWVQPPNFVYVPSLPGTPKTWSVTMPMIPGTYEFRLFLNNGFELAATSSPVTVSAPPARTIAVSAATSAPGGPITATLTNGPGGNLEWIALAVVGAPLDKWVQPPKFVWVSSLTGTPRTWSVTMPTTPGTYEFRWFRNDGFQLAAKSPTVTVQ